MYSRMKQEAKLIDHTGYENVFCEACPRVVCEISKGAVTHVQTVSKFRVSVRFRVGCCDARADSHTNLRVWGLVFWV